MTSTSTQGLRPIRPTSRLIRDQRAKAKRPSLLSRPNRKQPPPPGAVILEISSDDEQGIIDLTMDDSDDEGVPPAFFSTLAVSSSDTVLSLFSLHHF